jgi:hypothetical protein
MSWVGLKPTIPAFEQSKIVHALYRAAAAIDPRNPHPRIKHQLSLVLSLLLRLFSFVCKFFVKLIFCTVLIRKSGNAMFSLVWRFSFRLLDVIPAILIEGFRHFPQYFQANTGIVSTVTWRSESRKFWTKVLIIIHHGTPTRDNTCIISSAEFVRERKLYFVLNAGKNCYLLFFLFILSHL